CSEPLVISSARIVPWPAPSIHDTDGGAVSVTCENTGTAVRASNVIWPAIVAGTMRSVLDSYWIGRAPRRRAPSVVAPGAARCGRPRRGGAVCGARRGGGGGYGGRGGEG